MNPNLSQTSSRPQRVRAFPQPIQSAQFPDALLKVGTVCALVGLSESTIRRKVASGHFPKPVKDGPRYTRWVAGSVTAWLRAKGSAQ